MKKWLWRPNVGFLFGRANGWFFSSFLNHEFWDVSNFEPVPNRNKFSNPLFAGKLCRYSAAGSSFAQILNKPCKSISISIYIYMYICLNYIFKKN